MKKLLIACIIIFTAFVAFADEKPDYRDAFTLIEVWLDAQKDFDKLPGISAIIVDDQDVIWEGAYGYSNIEDRVKAKPNTLYSICSISKLFTSVAIMTLYDEGKLRLDDQIGDLLPWYDLKQAYPESGPITVRSIMTHSSGLPRESAYPYWTAPEFDFPCLEEVKGKLSDQETLYPASTYFQYSNLGLTLLGEIVEEVSGMPYDDYIEKTILKPLKMNDTRTVLPEKKYGKQLAVGYAMLDRQGVRERLNLFQAEGIKPAAGFSSNVEDLASFAKWVLRLRDAKEPEILKPSTLRNMHNIHWMDPDFSTTWGLGFGVHEGSDGCKWVGHNGSCPGYKTSLQINVDTKMAYSVMINANGVSPYHYAHAMNDIILKSQGESDNSDLDLSDYIGNYSEQPWYAETYMGSWYGKLVCLDLPAEDPVDNMTFLEYVGKDTFRRIRDNGELGEVVTFQRDEKGKVVSYKWFENYSKKIK
jgi:CubicO group peptidase (beta-lactamase class C family)